MIANHENNSLKVMALDPFHVIDVAEAKNNLSKFFFEVDRAYFVVF